MPHFANLTANDKAISVDINESQLRVKSSNLSKKFVREVYVRC